MQPADMSTYSPCSVNPAAYGFRGGSVLRRTYDVQDAMKNLPRKLEKEACEVV